MTDLPIQNGMIPDPLAGKREQAPRGVIGIIERYHQLRFWMILGFIGMSWFLLAMERMRVMTPAQLAHRIVNFLALYGYIAFLVVMMVTILLILWVEWKGWRELHTIDDERLDAVEIAHPYLPRKHHLVAALVLALTFPLFVWQAQAQIVALTYSEAGPEPANTLYTEQRSWQIANDGDGTPNTRTWDNGGGDGLWSTAANWSGDTVPDSDDTAYFGTTSTADATVNTSFAGMLKDLKVAPGYTGVITLARNLTLSGGSVIQSGGTLNFGTYGRTLKVGSGFITYPKATLTAGTGTILLAGTGTTQQLTSTGSFYNLTINNGLVGYWPMEEGTGSTVTRDRSGNEFNGTLTNGPTWSNNVSGTIKFNNHRSIHLDGSNDYVRVTTADALNPKSITVSAWVYPTLAAGGNQGIVSKSAATADGWLLYRANTSLTFGIHRGSFVGAVKSGMDSLNTWMHVAGTYNSNTGKLDAYLNGVKGTTTSTSGDITASNTDVAIGNLYTTGQRFRGLIDEVRVYDRALSDSEIITLANGYQDTGSGVYQLGSSLDVNGTLSIVSGGINASSNNLTVAGNWTNYGTFTKGTSTVTLDGSSHQTMSGWTVFNNFSATTSTARTIFFGYAGRQSVSGSLVLRGVSGNKLSLRSTRTASGARVDLDADAVQADGDIRYLDVKDVNSGSGQTLYCASTAEGCTDSGNNTNWSFANIYKTIAGTVYSDEGTTAIAAGKRINVSLNGGAHVGSGITIAGGYYRATLTGATLTGGTIISIYIDGDAADAVTVTLGSGSSMTGMHLYQDRLIVRSDSGSVALTNAHLNIADNSADADIASIYRVDASNVLQVSADKELFVWSGDTYTPGAAVKTHDLDVRGTLTLSTNHLTVSGSLVASAGTMTTSTGILLNARASNETLTFGSNSTQNLTVEPVATESNLAAWWKFDEGTGTSAADSTGNGNTGTLSGGPSWSAEGGNKIKFENPYSLNLDGVNDFMSTSFASTNKTYTYSMWVKSSQSSTSKYLIAAASDVLLFTWNAHLTGQIGFYDGDWQTFGNAPSDNAWHHLAMVFDAASGARDILYVDGKILGNPTNAYTGVNISDVAVAGRVGGGFTYGGLLDDVRIYNRALTVTEVRRLSAGYSGGTNSDVEYTLGSSLDVNGSLNLANGNLIPGSNTITVAGNYANYTGTGFVKGTSTVALDGTGNQTVSGSTIFNALTATTSTARTIFFDYTGRQSASGSLTLRGVSGNKLTLRSTKSGSGAHVDLDADATQLSTDFAQLDIKDMNAGSGQTLVCFSNTEGCVNSGNNTNWTITNNTYISGTVYSDTGATTPLTGVTVALSINGAAAFATDAVDNGGQFTIENVSTLTGGSILTLYIDGSTHDAVTVSTGSGGAMTGITLIKNNLIVRSGTGTSARIGSPLSSTTLNVADNNADADITAIYTMSSLNTTVVTGKTMYVWTGSTFSLDGTLTVGSAVTNARLHINGNFKQNNNAITVNGPYTQSGGTFTGSSGSAGIDINDSFTLDAGTFISTNSGMTIGYASSSDGRTIFSYNGGTFTHNSGTVTFDSTVTANSTTYDAIVTTNGSSITFYNLQYKGGNANSGQGRDIAYTLGSTDTLVVSNDFTIEAATSRKVRSDGGTIQVAGNYTIGNGADGGTAYVVMNGSSNKTYTMTSANTGAHLVVNKTGGATVSAAVGTTSLTLDKFTLSGGTFTAPTGTMTIAHSNTNNATVFAIVSGTTFNHNNGTLVFNPRTTFNSPTLFTIDVPSILRLYNISIDPQSNGPTVNRVRLTSNINDTIIAEGNLIHANGSLYGLWQVQGNMSVLMGAESASSIDQGADGGTGSIMFVGTSTQIVETELTGTGSSGTWTIAKPSGTAVLSGALTLNTSGQDLFMTGGTLDLNGNNLTVNDRFDVGTGTTLRLNGDETISGGPDRVQRGATLYYDDPGGSTQLLNVPYYHLILGSTGSTTFRYPHRTQLNLTGSLTISGGTLTVTNGQRLNVSGSLIQYKGGAFSAGTGTVNLRTVGPATLSGSSAFNHLNISNGLLLNWKFETGSGKGVVPDSSGNSKIGQRMGSGSVFSTSVPTTKYNNLRSMSFNGASDYVEVPEVFDGNGDFTAGLWFKAETGLRQHTFVGQYENVAGGNNVNGFWFMKMGNGQVSANIRGTDLTPIGGFVLNADGQYHDGAWHYAAMSRRGSTLWLYVDNTAKSTSTTAVDISTTGTPMRLSVKGMTQKYAGLMDDVRIYNRALSASEIRQLAAGYQDTGSGMYTLGSSLDVNGNLSIVGGGINAGSKSLNVAGNLANYGTFTKGTSTVTLDGSSHQTISGSTVFNTLSATTSTARTIFFDYTGRQSASGSLILRGVSGNKLSLRSTRSGSGARVDLDADASQISTDFAYLDIKDSNAGSGQTLICTVFEGCTDRGNNTNWTFGNFNSISGTAYSNEGTAGISAGRVVSISLNGGAVTGSGFTRAGGFYTATLTGATLTGGTIVTAYLDEATEDAVTVTLGTADSMTGMHLYQDRLIVRSDSGSVALTNNHLNVANNNADADIAAIYTIDSSNVLQVAADKELFVWSGDTYTPGAAVKTHDLDVRGTLTLASNDLTVSGSLVASSGTFTTSTGILLNARASSETLNVGSNSVQNMIINASGTDNGLVGWWKFDEGTNNTAADSSGNGNDGFIADATWNSAQKAPLYAENPYSLYFEPYFSRYVQVTDNAASYVFDNTEPFTMSAWVNVSEQTGELLNVFSRSGGGGFFSTTEWQMGIDYDGKAFATRMNDAGAYSDTAVSIGSWHHVAFRYDGTNLRAYLDGVGGTAVPSGSISANGSFGVKLSCTSGLFGSVQECFAGYMDDMRIYDRALTDLEISRLAAGTQSATVSTSNYTLGSSLDVNGNLELRNGMLTAGANTLTIAGNWHNLTGTGFIKGTSTVSFDGSGNQTLSGSTNFYGLSATTSAARTIFFDHSARQSASGSLTLRGVVGSLLSLRSTNEGDAAEIDLDADATQLSTDFAYLNIKDMNAQNGQMLICYTGYEGCIDNGNNTNWDFFPTAGTGTVKGLIWNDSDSDGVKDAGETTGLASVSVALTGTTATGGTINWSTTTASSGQFFFSGALVSNSAGYTVSVNGNAAPTGYIRTRFNSSGSNLIGTGTVVDVYFGYVLPSTVAGRIFVDTDKDGIRDAGETTNIGDVSVGLSGTSATGGTVSKTTTANSLIGYSLDNLPPSSLYTVSVNSGVPAGYVATRGTTSGVTVSVGGSNIDAHLGYYWYGTMSGVVFTDTDRDGYVDADESGRIENVTITLTGTTSTGASVNLTRTSTSTGAFSFGRMPLSTGNYTVTMTVPAQKVATNGNTASRALSAGLNAPSASFGLMPLAATGTVKGLVWNDEDGDGVKDAGEASGLNGVSVGLSGTTATGGTINWSTTTASTGQFFFSGALVSNTTGYTVTVNGNAAPTGYIRTRFNSSGSNLVGTGTVTDVQFGYVLPSTISGSVFVDSDEDGLHDGSETTVFNGVTLALTGTTSTGGSISLTTQTDSTGEYAFTGLPPVTGNYLLIITPPDDYDSTSTDSRSVAIGTGGQLKIQQFGYIQVAPPASSSSSSAASSTTSTDGEGGGTRGTTIVVQPTPVTGGTSSAPSSDSEEGEIDNQPAEEVRDLINNIDQRREERLKKLEETRDERVEETKDIVTDWVIGQVRVPIVPEVVNALSDAWRLALEIGQVSGEAMKDSTIAIGLGLNTVAEKAAFAVSDTTAAIEDQAVRTIELARAQGEAIIQVALSAGETVVSGVSEVTTVIASVVNTSIETAFNAADETLRQFGAAGEMVANALDGARIAAGEAIDTMQIAAADLVTLTGMGLQDLGETTATGVSEIAAVFGEAADVVTTDVGEAIALALVAVEDSAELTQQTIADTVELATIVATESIETVAVVAEEVNSVVTDVTTDVQVAMTETVESITQSASETIVSAGDSVREFGRRTGENARIAFEQMRRGVTVQEIAELPPQKQYETEIRKDEEGQILVAQLTMSIFDSLGLPVTNTPVVLFSTPKVSITNDEGVATFHDVEVGEHHIEVHINNGEEVLSQEIIIEPPANIDLDELEEVDAVLPVIQVVAAGSTMHGAAPYQLAWLWAIVGALTSSNIIWIVLWLRKRRDVA